MSEQEIDEAIKKHHLDEWDNLNFNTPKSTYWIYIIIAIFEHRKISCTRIINNRKCEVKVFKPRK